VKAVRYLVAIGLWVLASSAQAGLITLVGDTVTYEYDDAQAGIALFGAPLIVGDIVYFTPTTFRAESVGTGLTDTVYAEFVFSSVYTNDTGLIGLVQVYEAGDYGLANDGEISAAVQLEVESNGFPGSISATNATFDTGDYDSAQFFELSGEVNAAADLPFPSADVSIVLRNELVATSAGTSSVAWVQKKFVALTAGEGDFNFSPPVDVPAPHVLMLMGLGLALIRHRRNAKSQ